MEPLNVDPTLFYAFALSAELNESSASMHKMHIRVRNKSEKNILSLISLVFQDDDNWLITWDHVFRYIVFKFHTKFLVFLSVVSEPVGMVKDSN